MKVLIYVEGPSDRAALEALLRPILDEARRARVEIRFISLGGKDEVLERAPCKAAEHLRDDPDDWIIALPDLHPMTPQGRYPHDSAESLQKCLEVEFHRRADELRLQAEARAHFRAHCLQHDLEALLLAAPEALRKRLKTTHSLEGRWRKPVETQNGDKPPKRIVEELFKQYLGERYLEMKDAPWILRQARLADVEAACRRRFEPFVNDLRKILHGER